jgi:hypothetical protein
MDIVNCPTCGAPAEVERSSTLPSTSGPLAHVKVLCVNRHWYLMPWDSLCDAKPTEHADVASPAVDLE